ncbi:hypothetical protein [Flavobacterium sp. JP2137]|uniref:hypothetical protein n=1 Tax=Flavobacterium sp. JP2137 TaxID=3414510 RepID=UPI003D2FEE83
MRKSYVFSLLMVLFLSFSCSKSDDTDVGDPVYDAEYKPLQNLQQLESNTWFYVGSKVGDRKFGAISEKHCLQKNLLVFRTNNKDHINGYFDFYSYSSGEKACEVSFVTRLMVHYIADETAFCTYKRLNYVPAEDEDAIVEDEEYFQPTTPPTDENRVANLKSMDANSDYLKKVEIGFQAGYLRVEDKLTDFSGTAKVYLYFKKG